MWKLQNNQGITHRLIAQLRQAFRVGDIVIIPCPSGESSFRPNYTKRCTVKEIHEHYIVVSHAGLWQEAINYVDFLIDSSRKKVLVASKAMEDEYYALMRQYWMVSDLAFAGSTMYQKRLENIEERLNALQPLIDRRKRFSCLRDNEQSPQGADRK